MRTEEDTTVDDFLDGSLSPEEMEGMFIGDDDDNTDPDEEETEGDDEDNSLDPDDDDLPEDEDNENEEGADSDTEEEDAEEDDDAEDSKDQKNADDSDNEFYLRAKYWQEDGFLSPDVEIKKELTQLELENLYKEQIKENALNQIKTEVADILKIKGVNPDIIFGENFSQDEVFLKEYKFMASLTYDALLEKSEDDTITDTLKIMGTEYHLSKNVNLDDEEVATLVEKDLDKNTEEDLFKKYQNHFAKEAVKIENKIKADTAARKQRETARAEEDLKKIKDALKKYSPDVVKKIEDALYKKDQVFDNGKGVRKTGITLYEKRKLEAENDVLQQLEFVMAMVLKPDVKVIKEKHERIGAVNILESLATATLKGGKVDKSHKKLTTNKKGQEVPDGMFLPDN